MAADEESGVVSRVAQRLKPPPAKNCLSGGDLLDIEGDAFANLGCGEASDEVGCGIVVSPLQKVPISSVCCLSRPVCPVRAFPPQNEERMKRSGFERYHIHGSVVDVTNALSNSPGLRTASMFGCVVGLAIRPYPEYQTIGVTRHNSFAKYVTCTRT